MFEEWRSIPSQPDLMASSLGRIMVIPYQKRMPNGGRRTFGGTPTFGQWDKKRFVYSRRGHKTLKVHRLVCEAFNGEPKAGEVCMHLDENAKNNLPSNLSWGTQKQNLNATGFIAYCKSRTGASSPASKAGLTS